ncbi:MAG TPA: arginine--tRNA ligase [Armatimonadota bacterium]|jgi:arginyl-tRNA synthetase
MIKTQLTSLLQSALETAVSNGSLTLETIPAIEIIETPNKEFGDYACNAALALARTAHKSPRQVAEAMKANIPANDVLDRVEIAGPGFLNLYLKPDWLLGAVRRVMKEGERFGFSSRFAGKRVLLEFVSANPTGPILVVQGRAAALGDALANLLATQGYEVQREYYINDHGNQVNNFGRSVDARYRQLLGESVSVPEDGYQGEYLIDLAREILAEQGDGLKDMTEEERAATLGRLGVQKVLAAQKRSMEDFGVKFDRWFPESTLHPDAVQSTLDALKAGGHTYEKDGAVWLRSTDFEDDKDRPLVRANGTTTYIAADAAYHRNKLERGFDLLIDIWGPDHHGYIARTRAAVAAQGYDPERLKVIIHQIVRLYSGGEMVVSSKRAGRVLPLEELVEEVGADAARFFFLMRDFQSPLDFDLDLAKKQSNENPVYYVQYAHARICSIERKAREQGVSVPDPATADLSVLTHETEVALMRQLADYPENLERFADDFAPHGLTRTAMEMAQCFHQFYTQCMVLGDDPVLTAARLTLTSATRVVLRNILSLLGISAPEAM